MIPTKIYVTPGLIAIGLRNSKSNCPGILAIKYANDYFSAPKVDRNTVSLSDRETRMRFTWETPPVLRRFIDQLDTGVNREDLEPFNFTLDPGKAIDARPMQRSGPMDNLHATRRLSNSPRGDTTYRPSVEEYA